MKDDRTRYTWTDERVDYLRRMWAEGVSAGIIATDLGDGLTRSAVLGKVHRLKLPTHRPATVSAAVRGEGKPKHGNIGMPKVEKIREVRSIAAKRKSANENGGLAFKLVQARKDGLDLPEAMDAVLGKTRPDMPLFRGAAWEALPGSEPVPLDQRTGCAWPIGEDSPFLWCNLPVSGAGSFCAHHHKWSIARK